MKPQALKRHSKFLSLVLRHQPDVIGLSLDPQGWVEVADLLAALKKEDGAWTRALLDHVVENNNKKRFEYDATGTRIRARQGHSVTVDLGYEAQQPPAVLYHGTVESALPGILQSGLQKMSRHAVHLSADRETATHVGSRRGKPIILEVAAGKMHADGHVFHLSNNGVWLTDHVPLSFIKKC